MKNLITQHHARSQSTWAMGLFTMTLLTACGGGGDGVDSLAVDASLSLPPATAPAFKPSPAGTSQYQLHLDAATANAGTEFAGEQRRQWCYSVENAGAPPELQDTTVVPVTKMFDNIAYTGRRWVGQYVLKTNRHSARI